MARSKQKRFLTKGLHITSSKSKQTTVKKQNNPTKLTLNDFLVRAAPRSNLVFLFFVSVLSLTPLTVVTVDKSL